MMSKPEMKAKRALTALAAVCLAGLCVADESSFVKVADGFDLARKMRSAVPTASETLDATLTHGSRGNRVTRNVRMETRLDPDGWTICHTVLADNGKARETGCVRRREGERPLYKRNEDEDWKRSHELKGIAPLGKSAFLLTDFGMEFLFWPRQRLVDSKIKMKRGRPVFTLESATPRPDVDGYARVVSRVDREYLGVIQASVYDARGRLIKEFEPEGVVKGADDVYRVDALRMVDRRTRERTIIRFHYR